MVVLFRGIRAVNRAPLSRFASSLTGLGPVSCRARAEKAMNSMSKGIPIFLRAIVHC